MSKNLDAKRGGTYFTCFLCNKALKCDTFPNAEEGIEFNSNIVCSNCFLPYADMQQLNQQQNKNTISTIDSSINSESGNTAYFFGDESKFDYKKEHEKLASDLQNSLSEHRYWVDIIVQRSDTMKNMAEVQNISLQEITNEWTQSHFEEYKSKGGDVKEAKKGIITRLEAYGYIYSCYKDHLKKIEGLMLKIPKDDVKLIKHMIQTVINWDIASAQASLMGSVKFAQSLDVKDDEIIKYCGVTFLSIKQ